MEFSPSLTPATCAFEDKDVTCPTLGEVRDHFWLEVKTGAGRLILAPRLDTFPPSFLRGLVPRVPLARVGDNDPFVFSAAAAAPLPAALGDSEPLN